MHICEYCGRSYQSRSGLRRHVKAKHRGGADNLKMAPTPLEEAAAGAAASGRESGGAPDVQRSESRQQVTLADLAEDEGAALKGACKALKIAIKDVMDFKVYPGKVVIIEGPTGQKRVWKAK